MLPRTVRLLSAALGLTCFAAAALAQGYPNRPVRIVVPFAAGGPADNYARFLAQRLQDSLGQTFVVDNQPGGGSVIGTDIVAKARARRLHAAADVQHAHRERNAGGRTSRTTLTRDFVGIAPINYSDLMLGGASIAAGRRTCATCSSWPRTDRAS